MDYSWTWAISAAGLVALLYIATRGKVRTRDDRRSPEAEAYRKLSKSARWKKL